MDRNVIGDVMGKALAVALRKESVDRNVQQALKMMKNTESLSARRAWIEMEITGGAGLPLIVALRKESVDRNLDIDYYKTRK